MLTTVCLGLIYFQRVADQRTPVLTAISGRVNHSPGPLYSGQIIQTGTDSSATLEYPDGTLVNVMPDSLLRVPELGLTNRSKTLMLARGGISADVEPQGASHPMTLSSDHARAIVVGTQLSFHTSPARTRLEVMKGRVQLEPHGSTTRLDVSAGEFAEAHRTNTANKGKLPPPQPPQNQTPPSEDPPAEEPLSQKAPGPLGAVTGLILVDADSNRPVFIEPLADGQNIDLSSLPTIRISLLAEVEGERPFNVHFSAVRLDGRATGLKEMVPQHFAPFFLTGDYSTEGRPEDCRPWTPRPGTYRISATPSFKGTQEQETGAEYSLTLTFRK